MKTGYDDFFRKARVNTGVTTAAAAERFALKEQKAAASEASSSSSSKSSKEKAAQLRDRVRSARKKKKRPFPIRLAVLSLLGLCATVGALEYHEQIDHWISRLEVNFGVPVQASETAPQKGGEATGKKATAAGGEKREPASVDSKATEKAKTAEWSDADINHLQKLVERKEQLDAREAELARMETELAAQKEELEKKMKSMDETRTGISTLLQDRTTQDQSKVDTLVQVYSNMKAAQAAKVLESMDEDLAVEIIGKMKKKNAAEVLNLMKPEKAQVFSEKYAGYRKK